MAARPRIGEETPADVAARGGLLHVALLLATAYVPAEARAQARLFHVTRRTVEVNDELPPAVRATVVASIIIVVRLIVHRISSFHALLEFKVELAA